MNPKKKLHKLFGAFLVIVMLVSILAPATQAEGIDLEEPTSVSSQEMASSEEMAVTMAQELSPVEGPSLEDSLAAGTGVSVSSQPQSSTSQEQSPSSEDSSSVVDESISTNVTENTVSAPDSIDIPVDALQSTDALITPLDEISNPSTIATMLWNNDSIKQTLPYHPRIVPNLNIQVKIGDPGDYQLVLNIPNGFNVNSFTKGQGLDINGLVQDTTSAPNPKLVTSSQNINGFHTLTYTFDSTYSINVTNLSIGLVSNEGYIYNGQTLTITANLYKDGVPIDENTISSFVNLDGYVALTLNAISPQNATGAIYSGTPTNFNIVTNSKLDYYLIYSRIGATSYFVDLNNITVKLPGESAFSPITPAQMDAITVYTTSNCTYDSTTHIINYYPNGGLPESTYLSTGFNLSFDTSVFPNNTQIQFLGTDSNTYPQGTLHENGSILDMEAKFNQYKPFPSDMLPIMESVGTTTLTIVDPAYRQVDVFLDRCTVNDVPYILGDTNNEYLFKLYAVNKGVDTLKDVSFNVNIPANASITGIQIPPISSIYSNYSGKIIISQGSFSKTIISNNSSGSSVVVDLGTELTGDINIKIIGDFTGNVISPTDTPYYYTYGRIGGIYFVGNVNGVPGEDFEPTVDPNSIHCLDIDSSAELPVTDVNPINNTLNLKLANKVAVNGTVLNACFVSEETKGEISNVLPGQIINMFASITPSPYPYDNTQLTWPSPVVYFSVPNDMKPIGETFTLDDVVSKFSDGTSISPTDVCVSNGGINNNTIVAIKFDGITLDYLDSSRMRLDIYLKMMVKEDITTSYSVSLPKTSLIFGTTDASTLGAYAAFNVKGKQSVSIMKASDSTIYTDLVNGYCAYMVDPKVHYNYFVAQDPVATMVTYIGSPNRNDFRSYLPTAPSSSSSLMPLYAGNSSPTGYMEIVLQNNTNNKIIGKPGIGIVGYVQVPPNITLQDGMVSPLVVPSNNFDASKVNVYYSTLANPSHLEASPGTATDTPGDWLPVTSTTDWGSVKALKFVIPDSIGMDSGTIYKQDIAFTIPSAPSPWADGVTSLDEIGNSSFYFDSVNNFQIGKTAAYRLMRSTAPVITPAIANESSIALNSGSVAGWDSPTVSDDYSSDVALAGTNVVFYPFTGFDTTGTPKYAATADTSVTTVSNTRLGKYVITYTTTQDADYQSSTKTVTFYVTSTPTVFNVEYYKDSIDQGNLIDTVTGNTYFLPGYQLTEADIEADTALHLGTNWKLSFIPQDYNTTTIDGGYPIVTATDTVVKVLYTKNIATYTVTYHGNGNTAGANPDDANTYITGENATVLGQGSLVRDNYTFSGWATSANATTSQYQENDTLAITGNVDLYAVWTLNTYTVKFFSNEGTPAVEYIGNRLSDVPHDSIISKPASDPVRTGYIFAGWYTSEVGVNPGATDKWDFATQKVTADTSLYAGWNSYSYTVTYKLNYGTNNVYKDKVVASPDVTVGSLPADPQRSGYTFGGWFTVTTQTGGSQFTETTPVTADVEVYARWHDASQPYDILSGKDILLYVDDVAGMSKDTYLKRGLVSAVRTITGTESTITADDITVDFSKVQAKVGVYTVTFTSQYNGLTTINVRVVERSYDVIYKFNNGKADATTTSSAGVLVHNPGNPTKDNYTFDGWFSEGKKWDFSKDLMPAKTLVLEAKWTVISTSVSSTPSTPTPSTSTAVSSRPASSSTVPYASSSAGSSSAASSASPASASSNNSNAVVSSSNAISSSVSSSDVKTESTIGNSNIPMGGFTMRGAWSLLNLILSIICALMFGIMLFLYFGKRYNWRRPLALINLVLVILTILLLIFTTNFSLPMVFINNFTLLFIVLTVVQLVVLFIYRKENKKREEEERAEENV